MPDAATTIPGNMTRAEAAYRAALLRVAGYEVDLDLTTGPRTFRSATRVRFECRSPGAAMWIDLIADRIESATLNGQALDPAAFDGLRLQLPGLAADNVLEVVAHCRYMNTGEGLHRFVDPVDDEVYLYSQFESADARRVYACFEQPDLKGTFTLTVVAPAHWQVVSNSAATGEPAAAGPDSVRWSFAPTPVLSTYITALVAGPYHRVSDEYAGRFGTYPLGIFCRRSLAEHLDTGAIFHLTRQGFAYFEDLFDMGYPYGKYDQLFVPEFNFGAMENAGCVTFVEDYVFRSRVTRAAYEQRATTILHEMAHMWFGDLVTMRWWDDLWLNESFAEWAAHQACADATEFTEAWTSFAIQRKAWAYRQDQLPSTHPIAADMVDLEAVRVNFDGITYAKGASALKQLVAWVGQDNFVAGVRSYFREHALGNTDLADLLRHLERASGRDLRPWSAQWLQTSGVNLLRPDIDTAPDGTIVSAAVLQEPPAAPPGLDPVLRSHRIRIGLYSITDGVLARSDAVELDVTGARTDIPALVGRIKPDLLLLNDDDLTFAKIRLGAKSLATLRSSLGIMSDPLARTLAWGAAWDMTRDAEISTGEWVDIVLAGLPGEDDIAVVQTILRQTHTAVEAYAAPANRDRYSAALASALHEWMTAAIPGSDRQLALLRALAAVATAPEHVAYVAGLLDGTESLPGLAVDTDLRWSLLQRLVAVGERGDGAVHAEAERDPTAAGARNSARALASRPIAQAKADAWAAAVARDDLPNAVQEAILGGFAQYHQADLLRPYRDRFFAEIDEVWRTRTTEMAAAITMLAFPYHLVEPATVAAADDYLATAHHANAVRLVAEGRDTVARSLRAQGRDSAGS